MWVLLRSKKDNTFFRELLSTLSIVVTSSSDRKKAINKCTKVHHEFLYSDDRDVSMKQN